MSFFPAGKRGCDNVVITSLLTLSQHCGTVKNESDVSFRRCDNVALAIKTLPQLCYNVATTLSIGFLGHFTTDYPDFFLFTET